MKKNKENYLDYVFDKNPSFQWKEKEDGLVCIIVEWKGFFHWVTQKFFHKPKKSEIALDVLGSYVWKSIDGKRNVYQIAKLVKEKFGENAEPVYERLIKFIEIMRDNKYVVLEKEPNQSIKMGKMLYAKCEQILRKELKKREYLEYSEIEKLLKDVQVGNFTARIEWG